MHIQQHRMPLSLPHRMRWLVTDASATLAGLGRTVTRISTSAQHLLAFAVPARYVYKARHSIVASWVKVKGEIFLLTYIIIHSFLSCSYLGTFWEALCMYVSMYSTFLLQDSEGSYTCACDAGWTGQNCDVNINDCATDSCSNGAICMASQCLSI